jgi:uncharacterized protein
MKNYILTERLALFYFPILYMVSGIKPYTTTSTAHAAIIGTTILFLCLFTSASFIPDDTRIGKKLKIYSMGILFSLAAAASLSFIIFLIEDIRRFVFGSEAFTWHALLERSKSTAAVAFIGGLLIFSIMLYGMLFGLSTIRVRKFTLYFKNLPESFEGTKIMQFSDLHAEEYVSKKPLEKLCRIQQEEHPDFTFFTGDIINGDYRELHPLLSTLSELKNVYAILGNHDYGDYFDWKTEEARDMNQGMLVGAIQLMGWDLLRNEHRMLASDVALIGIENWSAKPRLPRKGDLKKAMAGVEDVPFKILLSHDPSHWEAEVLDTDIDLTLSGHTHGMQMGIRKDGLGKSNFKFSPAMLIMKYWAGLYKERNKFGKTLQLYVNTGIGALGYPGRIGMHPEVTMLTFKKS